MNKCDRKTYLGFLLIIFAIAQFQWSGDVANSLASGLRRFIIGVFFYSLGGFISRYNPFKKIRLYSLVLIIITTYAIRFVTSYNSNIQRIESLIAESESTGVQAIYYPIIHYYELWEIAVVILAVTIFEIFNRIRIPNSKIINYLGKSTLMIYFIHENNLLISCYVNDNWMESLVSSTHGIGYIAKWLYWAGIGLGLGVIVYSMYVLLGKMAKKMLFIFVRREME